MEGEILTINDMRYKFFVDFSYMEKVVNEDGYMGIKLAVRVIRVHDNHVIPWSEIKNSYVGHKITEYIENCVNGQRTFHWNWKREDTNNGN